MRLLPDSEQTLQTPEVWRNAHRLVEEKWIPGRLGRGSVRLLPEETLQTPEVWRNAHRSVEKKRACVRECV